MSLQAHGELVPVGGGDPIPLIRDKLSIGRRESCDICLHFPNVSGLHAELSFRNGYWHIRDKGSTNGIKVNSIRVQEKYLHPGDEITIAKRRFTISYELQAGRQALEEMMDDEDVLNIPLLERAGLVRPEREREERHMNFDPGEFLLEEDDGQKR
jgi:pSer/pThr/pTyr-binding forkhead associated (FHA) protein